LQAEKRSGVDNQESFQWKIRKLGTLVGELEAMPGPAGARDLVQLLMEVHGAGLERIMEIIDENGVAGEAIIARAGRDPIVRHLLLLYSLHPDDLDTRILTALEAAAGQLRKLNSEVELVSIHEGAVEVRVSTSGHACGSTGKTAQSIVEECIYDHAPDLTSLQIVAPEDAPSSGFVSLETLMKGLQSAHAGGVHGAEACGAD
jgi:hypothetical protein